MPIIGIKMDMNRGKENGRLLPDTTKRLMNTYLVCLIHGAPDILGGNVNSSNTGKVDQQEQYYKTFAVKIVSQLFPKYL